ncbi:ABC transporter substrate-binding protein [Streptomyces viridochromogenes]|uniref:Putative Extracellular solute-binding protein, family 1 n=1 Tax=Streptomyces viridochromogenes Tue57 TaxID=1160705 RepID=L8P3X2_STRVR|nr:extracellular solute-binding protein [Streptomyces viridochromogenes]ELS51145.1 putative Extracellular solute-binding protein, family 1 [Streptomyces viridochromogenes Tue57]
MVSTRFGPGVPSAPDRRPSRRSVLRGTAALGALATAGGTLAGCTTTDANAAAQPVPDYYPAGYDKIVDASRRERKLLIYSNTSQTNWQPIFDAFTGRYPWLDDIRATNLGSSAVYERYYSEAATGGSPADLLVSNGGPLWGDYGTRKVASGYSSPEKEHLPDWAEMLPGVWVFSADPVVILYNRKTLDDSQRPTGIASLAEIIETKPSRFRGKVGAYDPTNAFGYGSNYGYTSAVAKGWDNFARVLPFARADHSSGTLVEKVVSGEYDFSINLSGGVAVPAAEGSGGLLGWTYCEEGTVAIPRAASIVKTAPHPNAARLFVDFMLSAEGQAAVAKGGLTPYREGVRQDDTDSLQDIQRKLGADRVHLYHFTQVTEETQDKYVARWEKAMG